MRNRLMLSGSWPVKFCPPSSLQECKSQYGWTVQKRPERTVAHARYAADAAQVAQGNRHGADKLRRRARRGG
jgi:hypothetical protein